MPPLQQLQPILVYFYVLCFYALLSLLWRQKDLNEDHRVQAAVSEYTMMIKEQPFQYIPVKLSLTPVCLEVPFSTSLRYQVAIFRSSTDDKGKKMLKMDKTQPVKLTDPQQKISFPKALNLLTTMPFDPESQRFQNKEVELEIALQVDGSKHRLGEKINLKDVVQSKGKSCKFTSKKPEVTLSYRVEAKLERDPLADHGSLGSQKKKVLRFEDKAEDVKEEHRDNRNNEGRDRNNEGRDRNNEGRDRNNEGNDMELKARRDRSNRHKTIAVNLHPEYTADIRQIRQEIEAKHNKIVKCKSHKNYQEKHQSSETLNDNASIETKLMKKNEDKSKQLAINTTIQSQKKTLQSEKRALEKRLKEKEAKLQGKDAEIADKDAEIADQKAEIKEKNAKLQQKEAKIETLLQQIQQLQNKHESESKSDRSTKDLLKRQQTAKQQLEKQVAELKEEIRANKKEIEKLAKTAASYQQGSRNIAAGTDAQIKTLNDRIRQLQRTESENTRQLEEQYAQLKDKEEAVSQLKGQLLSLQKENLELRQTVKEWQKKLQNQKEEYEGEMEELRVNVKEVKDENKTLKLPSSRDFKEDSLELKKKIESLEKQLERKEELLRKMTEIKSTSQTDTASQNSSLKREVADLKDIIDKLESKRSEELSSTSSIEYRVQLEKMKKELELCKKNEKALLIEKGRVEANSRQLQDEIIKGKQTIVNILNLVQDTGNDKLITEAYSLME